MGRHSLVVEADGGSRGNPGNAGYGALVRDAVSGRVLAERAGSVGIASNNVAEYSGLVAGLLAAQSLEPGADVEVRMDSKLVVEQMSGRWKVKHEDMRRLALEAGEVADGIRAAGGAVRYTWVPRSMNAAADALANAAMDGRTVWRDLADADALDEPMPTTFSPSPQAQAADEPRTTVSPTGLLLAPTRVVLVRHGVTDFTATGKLDGRGGPDPSLNADGREQARRAGTAVAALVAEGGVADPPRVVTSDLARGRQTGMALAAALGVEPEMDADWDEQGFGDWHAESMAQLRARFPEQLLRLRNDPQYRRPGGESHAELHQRVLAAFARAAAPGGTVVIATHRKPIMVVLGELLGIPHERLWRLATAPASLSGVELWDDGGVSVAFVNDTLHLR